LPLEETLLAVVYSGGALWLARLRWFVKGESSD
jgi:hypothetical protein